MDQAEKGQSPSPAESQGIPPVEPMPGPTQPSQGAEVPAPPEEGPEQRSDGGIALDLGSAVTYRENVAKGDGFLEISVAADAMSATADLHPPKEGGLPLSIEQAQVLCARLGIVEGLDWDGLSEAVFRCNLENTVVRGLVFARGIPAVAAVSEHALVDDRLKKKNEAAPEDALRYDFRERKAMVVVQKGETLAKIIPSSEGKEGLDIRGGHLSAPRVQVASVSPGKNVSREEDRLVALVDGILNPIGEDGSGQLDIEEVLLVHGDVGYKTGHIIFPGDVIIDGAVEDGFKVWSGASIHCKTTLDAFDVNAKADLLCDQGIIGRRRAQVRVGGELRAKFIQNCRVAARGDIHVHAAIVNCHVYSLGRVELGDKGVLMGGEIYAVHGIKAFRLGSQAHQPTIVHAGTDFTVQQRLDQANEKLRLLSLGAHRAREEAANRPSKALDLLLAQTAHTEAGLHDLIGQLLTSLDADEGATVEVKGEIYPGTVIDICRVSIVVDELLTSCRFRLDKAAGTIRVERGGSKGEKGRTKDHSPPPTPTR